MKFLGNFQQLQNLEKKATFWIFQFYIFSWSSGDSIIDDAEKWCSKYNKIWTNRKRPKSAPSDGPNNLRGPPSLKNSDFLTTNRYNHVFLSREDFVAQCWKLNEDSLIQNVLAEKVFCSSIFGICLSEKALVYSKGVSRMFLSNKKVVLEFLPCSPGREFDRSVPEHFGLQASQSYLVKENKSLFNSRALLLNKASTIKKTEHKGVSITTYPE